MMFRLLFAAVALTAVWAQSLGRWLEWMGHVPGSRGWVIEIGHVTGS